MGVMKISAGPRYQRTGSPLQKKGRQFTEMAEKILDEVLTSTRQRSSRQKSTPQAPKEKS